MKLIDEVGNRYGRLVVIKRTENKGTRAQWLCKCDCGNEIVVVGKNLRQGATKSCGCLKRELLIERNIKTVGDLSGRRFGKLVVLEQAGYIQKSQGKKVRLWKCKCDCGNVCKVQTQYLMNGDTESCGCMHSRGESKIEKILNLYNNKYIKEFSFDDFTYPNGGRPRFDFALFKNDKLCCLIEFQGSIHFKAEGSGWNTQEALIIRKQKDEIKRQYCKTKNIKLYEITYLDDIKKKMEEIINEQYETDS